MIKINKWSSKELAIVGIGHETEMRDKFRAEFGASALDLCISTINPFLPPTTQEHMKHLALKIIRDKNATDLFSIIKAKITNFWCPKQLIGLQDYESIQ